LTVPGTIDEPAGSTAGGGAGEAEPDVGSCVGSGRELDPAGPPESGPTGVVCPVADGDAPVAGAPVCVSTHALAMTRTMSSPTRRVTRGASARLTGRVWRGLRASCTRPS
jgi:hypothetical protein